MTATATQTGQSPLINARTGDTLVSREDGRTFIYCDPCGTWNLYAHPHADLHPEANRFPTSGRYVLTVSIDNEETTGMVIDTQWSDQRQDVADSVTRESNAHAIVAALHGVTPDRVSILTAVLLD